MRPKASAMISEPPPARLLMRRKVFCRAFVNDNGVDSNAAGRELYLVGEVSVVARIHDGGPPPFVVVADEDRKKEKFETRVRRSAEGAGDGREQSKESGATEKNLWLDLLDPSGNRRR